MGETFDDYYNNGLFELARKGEHVFMRNNMSPEQRQTALIKLAKCYPKQKKKIERRIRSIRKRVSKCRPLELLSYCSDMFLFGSYGKESESQMTKIEVYSTRVTEYIQSILVSSESKPSRFIWNRKKLFQRIFNDIVNLHEQIEFFYLSWAASLEQLHPEFDEETRKNLFEAQLLYMVRGKRYQVFEFEYFERLLVPHNEAFQRLFGLSSKEIIDGIKKLQFALSQGKFDAINKFGELIDQAAENGIADPKDFFNQNKEESTRFVNKLFGTELRDVLEITGWTESFVNTLSFRINECSDFFDNSEYSGWPVIDLPIQKRPFIKLGTHYYCFDYYSFVDNFYRAVQKAISRTTSDYKWSDVQKEASENMVADVFSQIFPGCTIFRDNYYPKNKSIKQLSENDLIIRYADVVIIVEVKAGSFVFTSPIKDFEHHIVSYKSLIEKADHQCKNTYDYLHSYPRPILYNQDATPKAEIDMSKVTDVFMITVTIDNINDFAAKAEKLNFLKLKCNAISLSIDDLMVYREFFDSPLVFLHFLSQRRLATQEKKLALNDELDHLGMYIKHNMYCIQIERYPEDAHVIFHGYREELDKYFCLLYHPQLHPSKPSLEIPDAFRNIIDYLEKSDIDNRVEISNYLLCFSSEAKQELIDMIQYALHRQQITKNTTVFSTGGDDEYSLRYTLFVQQPRVKPLTHTEKREYALSSLLWNDDLNRVILEFTYDQNNQITNIEYSFLTAKDVKETEYHKLFNQAKKRAEFRIAKYIEQHGSIDNDQLCPCGSGKRYAMCCKLPRQPVQ